MPCYTRVNRKRDEIHQLVLWLTPGFETDDLRIQSTNQNILERTVPDRTESGLDREMGNGRRC